MTKFDCVWIWFDAVPSELSAVFTELIAFSMVVSAVDVVEPAASVVADTEAPPVLVMVGAVMSPFDEVMSTLPWLSNAALKPCCSSAVSSAAIVPPRPVPIETAMLVAVVKLSTDGLVTNSNVDVTPPATSEKVS